MTAKEYLLQIAVINRRIETLSEMAAHARSSAEYSSPSFENMPKSPTRNIRKQEDATIRALEYDERIRAEQEKLNEIRRTIDNIADPTAQTIIFKRYVEYKTWEAISHEMFFCLSHVYRLHNAAVDTLSAMRVNESS